MHSLQRQDVTSSWGLDNGLEDPPPLYGTEVTRYEICTDSRKHGSEIRILLKAGEYFYPLIHN
jgi:hypothetical protein